MGDSTRIRTLDGVRGVAIVMVLAWHFVACLLDGAAPGSLAAMVARPLGLMWSGVDLFFVLSGFLIMGILLDNRESTNLFRVFYARRAFRILPLYVVVLWVYLLLVAAGAEGVYSLRYLFDDPLPAWSFATFTQNVVMGVEGHYGQRFLGSTWSLAVEEQFYVAVPLLAYFLPRRALVPTLVALVASAPLLRWASPGFHAFVSTPWRSDSLLSGALLAVAVRWAPFLPLVRRHVGVVLALLTLLAAVAAALTWRPELMGPLDHTWLAGLYCVIVLLAYMQAPGALTRTLGSRVLAWLGERSYGIYLFHQIALGMMFWAVRGGPPTLASFTDAALVIATLGATLLGAEASYRWIERPCFEYGRLFRYGEAAAIPRSAAQGSSPSPVL